MNEIFEISTKHGGHFTIEKQGKDFFISDERNKQVFKGFLIEENKIIGVTSDNTIVPIIAIPLISEIKRKLPE